MCMTSALDITRAVKPPRATFLDFPLGHTTGKPHEPAQQEAIVRDALAGFETIDEAGMIQILPYRWDDSDRWRERAMPPVGARLATPQYQEEPDRLAAAGHSAAECPLCAVD
ncbi:MAG: hypothetical protein ACR2PL_09790 [Dehalococcoidia bacterium]